ncbi:MAG: hypothetical protein A2086_02075 [Spirochaetes bacterium GWD1_27_9]|nr:MAG: hypothetical protein A2Z98_06775 [Spirochaetes bacterium GWB1_27_13]OHD27507.1 MAG: hypothetical protein A2Y34_04610 [Spirochaetes bacterium GWC1_27_15]OHD41701.1 MAG: hypothetical protein A2086_02075 [Spirochaetes bacterium GWD1_27_9]
MLSVIIVIAIFITMLWYTVFYILSVGPAQLEKKIGERSYKVCAILRKISFVGMALSMIGEILYFFFPMNIGIKERIMDGVLGWVISILIGLLLCLFATLIIVKVSKIAKDSFVPQKSNEMFGGIYNKIRHPQAIADVTYWFALAFLLNSLFLLLIAILWIPLNLIIVVFEERDLKIRYGSAYLDYMSRTGRFFPRRAKYVSSK